MLQIDETQYKNGTPKAPASVGIKDLDVKCRMAQAKQTSSPVPYWIYSCTPGLGYPLPEKVFDPGLDVQKDRALIVKAIQDIAQPLLDAHAARDYFGSVESELIKNAFNLGGNTSANTEAQKNARDNAAYWSAYLARRFGSVDAWNGAMQSCENALEKNEEFKKLRKNLIQPALKAVEDEQKRQRKSSKSSSGGSSAAGQAQ